MMKLRNKIAILAAATTGLLATQTPLSAEPTHARHREPSHFRHHKPHFNSWHIRDKNYYSDWNSVRKIRGHGTYVVSNGSPSYNSGGNDDDLYIVKAPSRGVKIIDVANQYDPCSYEHGVCVIRGID